MLPGTENIDREAAKARDACREDLARLAMAAVDGVETLAETAAAYLDQLPPESREAVGIAIRSAWERLESAGVSLDGVVGEALDGPRQAGVLGHICEQGVD